MTPQWKMIYLARRNPALVAEDFPQAWREHSALGRQCRNVQDKVLGVAQCSRLLDTNIPGASVDYDGVNVLRLRDRQAADDIWNDAETLAIMRPDEPRVFSTYVRDFTLVCSEQVLRDAPHGECALFGFLRRRADLSRAAFDAKWLGEGSRERGFAGDAASARWLDSAALRGAVRAVHNAVVATPPPGYEFDGIAEWWFRSPAALRAAFAARGVATGLPAAYADLIDVPRSVFVATQVTHSRP